MSNKNLRNYFKKAEKEGWAIGHFNISNLETLKAIFQAAKNLKSPVIIGTSESESGFLGMKQAAALVKSLREENNFPIFLNLDHGKNFLYIKKAVDAGYDMVHFDGSSLPLKKNIKIAKKVVAYAKDKKVLVEGEVGVISGSSTILKKALKIRERDLTNPEEAEVFLKETKVNVLAVNVGTFHGMKASGKNPRIDLERLKEIKKKIGDTPLVLHGGSGTPKQDIKKAVKIGISDIHINTELRVAFTGSLRKVLKGGEIVPYKYMPEVIEKVQKIVEEKIKLFGSRNKI